MAAYYLFDETEGIFATDTGSNRLQSMVSPVGVWSTGKYGNSINFENSEHVLSIETGKELSEIPEESFSLSMWVYSETSDQDKYKESSIQAHKFEFSPNQYYFENIESLLERSPTSYTEIDGSEASFSPLEISNLAVWFDANDINANDTKENQNLTLTDWKDKSLNKFHAFATSSAPQLKVGIGPNNGNAVEIRGGKYMSIDGSFFAKDHFYVFRSPPGNNVWSGYGGVLGHNPVSGHDQRGSNYITQRNETYFHHNQYPAAVWKFGGALTGNFNLTPITEYMVLRLQVNDKYIDDHNSYQIGRLTGLQCDLDIAEIIAFEQILTDADAHLIEGYLAHKWNLSENFSSDHPYKEKTALEEVVTTKRLVSRTPYPLTTLVLILQIVMKMVPCTSFEGFLEPKKTVLTVGRLVK